MTSLINVLQIFFLVCLMIFSNKPAEAFVLSNGDEIQCQFSRDGLSGNATEIWNTYRNCFNLRSHFVKHLTEILETRHIWEFL